MSRLSIINSCKALGIYRAGMSITPKNPGKYMSQKLPGTASDVRKRLKSTGNNKKFSDNMFSKFKEEHLKRVDTKFNSTNLEIFFVDFLFHVRPLNYQCQEYFDYRCYDRDTNSILKFLGNNQRRSLLNRICDMPEHIFETKYEMDKLFEGLFVHRAFCFPVEQSLEEFETFVSEHPTFLAKPASHSKCGHGISIIDSTDKDVEKLYTYCQENNLLCEQLVEQHEVLANVYNGSANILRFHTLITPQEKQPVIIAVAIRFGCKINSFGGPLMCCIDKDTGIISTDIAGSFGAKYKVHPNTKVKIKGIQIPNWESVKNEVLKAALLLPAPHGGWDVAINKDGSIEVIEVNTGPSMDVIQVPDNKGKRYLYEKYLKPVAEAEGKVLFKGHKKTRKIKDSGVVTWTSSPKKYIQQLYY